MKILERMNLALEAMLEKAEEIYRNSPENYPARGDRCGVAAVTLAISKKVKVSMKEISSEMTPKAQTSAFPAL